MNNVLIDILHVSSFSSIEHLFLHRMEKQIQEAEQTQETPLPSPVFLLMHSPLQINVFSSLFFLLSYFSSLPAFSSFHGLHFRREASCSNPPVASSKQLHRDILDPSSGGGRWHQAGWEQDTCCVQAATVPAGSGLYGEGAGWGMGLCALADNVELQSRPDHKDSF